jgi:predicted transcriptional regulator
MEKPKSVKELMVERFVKVREGDRVYEVIQEIVKDRETMLACVVDENGKLKGIITPKEILRAVEVREFGAIKHPFFEGPKILHLLTSRYAKDIMSPPVSVKPESKIEEAIDIMLDKGFYEVPVVDKKGKILGEINYFNTIISSVEYLKKEQ